MSEAGLIRKLIGSFLGIALISALIGLAAYPSVHSTKNDNDVTNNNLLDNQEEPESKVTPGPAPLYPVLSVTDGDTIRIDYNGTSTPVRLIGINTPETVDQRTTVQCFGKEASDYLKSKLTGKSVTIEADPSQSDRDKYDRLLRYVYLDGEDVGLSIVSNGYGHEYTYAIPHKKQSEYRAAEKSAESQNLGLWSPTTCNGDTSKSATSAVTPASSASSQATSSSSARTSDTTTVSTSSTETEAVSAGWRKAKV